MLPPAPTACRQLISGSISLPLSGFFSPFPHGTSSLSVADEYLGLEVGPPIFRLDFTCPALLKSSLAFYLYVAITLYCLSFHTIQVITNDALACSAFAHHYSRNLMFDFFSSDYLDISVHRVSLLSTKGQQILPKQWVFPFGNPRIKAYWQLPVAYRSLLRPSSPVNAKASINRP